MNLSDCPTRLTDDFLTLLNEYLDEADLEKKIRKLIRIEGYLRYLFFESLGLIREGRGADLSTLICGLSVVIAESSKHCIDSDGALKGLVCGLARDSIDLLDYVMLRWRNDSGLREMMYELWRMLDPENPGEREEVEVLSREVARSILGLL